MGSQRKESGNQADKLVAQIRGRALNMYQNRQLLCAEAVLVALNHGLGGGLSDDQAVALAAPFCVALGDSGCLCGALSGAVMGSGLFLGQDRPYGRRRGMRESARYLHDAFKATTGATCCRVLCQTVRHDEKAHFQQCAGLTAEATELAARLILEERPELMGRVDTKFLCSRQSKIGGAFLRLARLFSH